jgi:hypothetical protein
MPRVGFEHTIPVFEGAKTVHALDRAATLNGDYAFCFPQVLLLGRGLRGQGGVIMNCWVNTNGKETTAVLSLDTERTRCRRVRYRTALEQAGVAIRGNVTCCGHSAASVSRQRDTEFRNRALLPSSGERI